MVLLNGSKLPAFEALDDDAGNFGDVSFTFDLNPENIFEFQKIDRKSSELRLISAVEEKVYEVKRIRFFYVLNIIFILIFNV